MYAVSFADARARDARNRHCLQRAISGNRAFSEFCRGMGTTPADTQASSMKRSSLEDPEIANLSDCR